MLEHVADYDIDIPKGRSNKATRRWQWIFVLDFLFSLSNKKDASGNVIRKADQDSWIGRKYREAHDRNVKYLLRHNAEYNYSGPVKVPSIEAEHFNKDFFKFWSKKIHVPLVIKGFLKDAQILDEATHEGLIRLHGDKEVKCLENKTIKASHVGQNWKLENTTLKEFLTSSTYDGYYVNNFYGILTDEDFKKKCYGDRIDNVQGKRNILYQWFISRSNRTGSTLHCAEGDNMFLNISGKKEWYFIDHTYTSILQPSISKYAIYGISELHEDLDGDFYSDMITNYPYLKHVPIYRCVLEEGDMLFNPPYWWHRVQNQTKFTVGCAIRYFPSKQAVSLPFALAQYIDVFKHPTKSLIPTMIGMMINKKRRGRFLELVFSRKD